MKTEEETFSDDVQEDIKDELLKGFFKWRAENPEAAKHKECVDAYFMGATNGVSVGGKIIVGMWKGAAIASKALDEAVESVCEETEKAYRTGSLS